MISEQGVLFKINGQVGHWTRDVTRGRKFSVIYYSLPGDDDYLEVWFYDDDSGSSASSASCAVALPPPTLATPH